MTAAAVRTVQELATETRAINFANGWGTTFTLADLPAYVALIHSEVTEAFRAILHDETTRELGDVIVRALDLCELIQPGIIGTLYIEGPTLETTCYPAKVNPRYLPQSLCFMELHSLVSEVLEAYRKVKAPVEMQGAVLAGLCDVIAYAWACMKATSPNHTPTAVIEEILTKNRKRGYRHGGRRT